MTQSIYKDPKGAGEFLIEDEPILENTEAKQCLVYASNSFSPWPYTLGSGQDNPARGGRLSIWKATQVPGGEKAPGDIDFYASSPDNIDQAWPNSEGEWARVDALLKNHPA